MIRDLWHQGVTRQCKSDFISQEHRKRDHSLGIYLERRPQGILERQLFEGNSFTLHPNSKFSIAFQSRPRAFGDWKVVGGLGKRTSEGPSFPRTGKTYGDHCQSKDPSTKMGWRPGDSGDRSTEAPVCARPPSPCPRAEEVPPRPSGVLSAGLIVKLTQARLTGEKIILIHAHRGLI